MMTDKQTKPEGSSGAKGFQLVLSLHPPFSRHDSGGKLLDFLRESLCVTFHMHTSKHICLAWGGHRSGGSRQMSNVFSAKQMGM